MADAHALQHPMAVVTRRTGLRPDVIRAWERRHGAVAPRRSEGNRRLYTDEDVERLTLLRRAVEAGWPISRVAPLPDDALRDLLRDAADGGQGPGRRDRAEPPADQRALALERHLAAALGAAAALDAARLREALGEAAVQLSRVDLLDRVVAGLVARVGDGICDGSLRIAHEHLATEVVATFLDGLEAAYSPSATAPSLMVTTPAHQHHALGGLLAAATARVEGWRATWLGPNLPAAEIAAAARQARPRALALSLGFPAGDARVARELEELGVHLGGAVPVLVGGAAAASYQAALDRAGARRLQDLAALRGELRRLAGA